MEDAEVVGSGKTVGGLNTGGEDKLEAGGASAMSLSRDLPGMYCMTM